MFDKIQLNKIKIILFCGKILLMLLILYLVFSKLSGHAYFGEEFIYKINDILIKKKSFVYFIILLTLTFFNWSLEALKWQRLVRSIELLSFKQALQSVLAGLALSFIGSAHVGGYLGRVWFMRAPNRYSVLGALWVGNYFQSFFSYFFGLLGITFLCFSQGYISKKNAILLLIVCSLLGVFYLLFSFFFKKFTFLLSKYPRLHRFIAVAETYTKTDFLYVFAIAGVRYAVFSIQFFWAALLFDIALPYHLLASGICAVFFIKSAVPNLNFLTDLGIRELSAYFFLGSMGANEAAVLGCTLLVWIINLLLPVTVGALLSIRMKVSIK
jgi:hypothetical protein